MRSLNEKIKIKINRREKNEEQEKEEKTVTSTMEHNVYKSVTTEPARFHLLCIELNSVGAYKHTERNTCNPPSLHIYTFIPSTPPPPSTSIDKTVIAGTCAAPPCVLPPDSSLSLYSHLAPSSACARVFLVPIMLIPLRVDANRVHSLRICMRLCVHNKIK